MAGKLREIFTGRKCMCLDTGHRAITPTPLIQSGWKNFHGSGKILSFAAMQYKKSTSVPLDQWITAEGGTASGSTYEAGFHIYENETEFAGRVGDFRRVYFRQAHRRGTQDKKTVIVAREMYVPSDPEAWPPKN